MAKLQDEVAYAPRGMNAERAAAYCDLSKTKFLELVDNGTLPACKDLGGVPRWDRKTLDAAWDALDNRKKPAHRKSLEQMLEAESG
jgi:hypothetical protein